MPKMKTAVWIDLVNALLAELTRATVYCCGSARKVSEDDKAHVGEGDEKHDELTGESDILPILETDSASTRPPSYISELPMIEEESLW
jgi:hypothetical protein